jgi:hypothetical protein
MREEDFGELGGHISQMVLHGRRVAAEISAFRKRITEMNYCLPVEEARPLIQKLWGALS